MSAQVFRDDEEIGAAKIELFRVLASHYPRTIINTEILRLLLLNPMVYTWQQEQLRRVAQEVTTEVLGEDLSHRGGNGA